MNRKFKVGSRSNKNLYLYYIVEETKDGLACSCPAGIRDKKCNHKDVIRKFLDRQHQSFEDLKRIEEI